MDKIDIAIVSALQAEGRLSNLELAERVGLSPSPCLRRVRNLEARGVLCGYRAVVDPRKLGLAVTAFMRIRLERHEKDAIAAFEAAVRGFDEVVECHLLTGNSDYLLRVLVADLDAYEQFLRNRIHRLPGIASIDSSFAFGEIKRASAILPRPPHRSRRAG